MIKLYAVTILAFLLTPAFAQRLAKITIDNSGNSDIITFLVDETVLVNMTKEGKIIDWGTENSALTRFIPEGWKSIWEKKNITHPLLMKRTRER